MKFNSLKASMILGAACLSAVTFADTTGTIDASLTLTDACLVNGGTATSGVNFGSIDFGTHNTFFTEADSTVVGDGVAGSIEVACSTGVTALFKITGGANDANATDTNAAGLHALKHSTENVYISYALYSDAGFTTPIDSTGTSIPLGTGTATTFDIWGRAFGGDDTLVAGTYSDTIQVLIDIQ